MPELKPLSVAMFYASKFIGKVSVEHFPIIHIHKLPMLFGITFVFIIAQFKHYQSTPFNYNVCIRYFNKLCPLLNIILHQAAL